MEKVSNNVVVIDELPLVTDIQYLEAFTSKSLNRKFSGMVHKGVFRGFECEAVAGKHILVTSKDITGVALVERDDYVLTVRQQDDVLVDMAEIRDGYVVLEAFYQFGVPTKQVDNTSSIDAASIKFVAVGQTQSHHTILCRVTLVDGAPDVTPADISYIERDYGGADIAQHVNTPDPHKQYLLREEAATTEEINNKSNLEKYLELPKLWTALDNALKAVTITTSAPLQATGNALNGITLGIQLATLERQGVVTLSGNYATASDELAATTAAVQRAVNHVIDTCLDKGATAVAAKKIETAFNLALAGNVTGSVSLDGSQDVTLNVTVKKDSHRHTIGYIDGLQDALDSKSPTTHLHDDRYIRSFTLMDEDNARHEVEQGKFVRFASNPNISLKWAAAGDGSEQSPYVLEASVPDASTSSKGVSQLSSSTTSTSETQAATPKGVKTAKEQAISTANTNATNYTNQEIAKLKGEAGAHASLKEVSDAVVSNDGDIAQINKTLPTKANNATLLNTTGAITGGGQIGDELTIGIKDATTAQKGAVQLSSSVTSTSETLGSTAKATKTAHDRAVSAEQAAKAYTDQLISQLLGDAPAEHLNTLKELGDALVDNDSDIAAINAELAKKANKAIQIVVSGALTGGGDLTGNVQLGINDASTAQKGAVQLSSAVNSTSEVLAATPKAVKTAYDLAASKWAYTVATTAKAGAVQLSSAINSTSEAQAATPKAVKLAYDLAAGKWTYRVATTAQTGAVQLSSAINSTSEAYAATPKAVKSAYDLAASKMTQATGDGRYLMRSAKATLTDNDGHGQASVVMNHKGGIPQVAGSSYRIDGSTDSVTATLTIALADNVKAGTEVSLKQIAVATTGVFDFLIELREKGQRVFSPNNRNISDVVNSASSTVYASSKAAKTAYDKAVSALGVANGKWTYRVADLTAAGAVQLSSATNSTSEALAATPKAVKIAYDLAASKWVHRAASTTQTGTVQLTNAVNSTSETLAASAKAVKTAYDKANHSHPYAPASHRHNFSQIDAGTSTGVFIAGDFKGTSDRRLKSNIEQLPEGVLDKLLKLGIYSYVKHGVEEIGVIAQELQEQIPTLVSEGEDGYLSVSHFGLNACSIKAIQEQQVIIDQQAQLIEQLAERLSKLEDRL
ncbi:MULTISPECIES: tail fiber protein [unclassified Vibrio]|uniref:tail fiber protein n=1 Tax=unclassified Vibrio TaxID=2614977 RepID=UPI0012689BBD|nr:MULTISPECIES: tail fiber protein [unclassified Vibrio]QFT40122.1 Phage tail fiber repeat protein [Vibrio sp. THAF64]QGM37945.1 Phage tail fiber repeat protein [Vibrio sp. THAF191d]QGN73474.1 Phage tail fiber repeat protein [Vibrio sp. THAF191c]